MAFLRASKYRNAVLQPYKREQIFRGLSIHQAGPEASTICASNNHIAVGWSSTTGGTVGILDVGKPGQFGNKGRLVHAHAAALSAMSFSPHDDNLLATAAEDCVVKLWKLPEDIPEEGFRDASHTLTGHARRITTFQWHPVAGMVLASVSDKDLWVWDVEAGEKKLVLDHPDQIYSLCWSWDGRLLATTCKDKMLRVWDPRTGSSVLEVACHEGTNKSTRVVWLDRDGERIGTTGFSKYREQQFRVWDAAQAAEPLKTHAVGSSTGVLWPLVDIDTGLVVLGSKGDSTMRVVECTDAKPFVQEVASLSSDTPHLGLAMLPKTACDVMASECACVLKLTRDAVEPIMVKIPRKSYSEFSEELYPPTVHIGGPAALTAEQWLAGDLGQPTLKSLEPAPDSGAWPSQTAASSSAPREEEEKAEGSGAAEPYVLSDSARAARKIVRESHFRHIRGKVSKPQLCYHDLRIGPVAVESPGIKVNKLFFAVPWTGGGGCICVWPLGKLGRLPVDVPLITGHSSNVIDWDFCPTDDHVIATGAEDATVCIWTIPDGGLAANLDTPSITLKGHSRKVSVVNYHPYVRGALLTGAADNTVRVWDSMQGSEARKFGLGDEFGDTDQTPVSMDVKPDGSLIVVTTRDKHMRVMDPRQEAEVESVQAHTGSKGVRCVWLGSRNWVMTTGISKSSEREFKIWDARVMSEPLSRTMIDVGSGALLPFFDVDTSVLFLAGKGDSMIRTFEINDDAPFAHSLASFNPGTPLTGLYPLPKDVVDVKMVETRRFLRVTPAGDAEPVSFTVPRTRTEFFQDDVFPDTFDFSAVSLDVDSWVAGEVGTPPTVSLKPDGMVALSEAPEDEKPKAPKYRLSGVPADAEEELSRDGVFTRFYEQVQSAREGSSDEVVASNFNFVTPDQIARDIEGVDEDEWDD